MTSRPIRLGISFAGQGSVGQLVAEACRAEQIGFDTVLLIDHLGATAPLPPLVAIAAAVPSVRVGTLVINTSFHRPPCWPATWPASIRQPMAASTSASEPATSQQNSPRRVYHSPITPPALSC